MIDKSASSAASNRADGAERIRRWLTAPNQPFRWRRWFAEAAILLPLTALLVWLVPHVT